MTQKTHAEIAREIEALNHLTVSQLQEKWEEVWKEPCRSRNKDNLRKRIAWRIQALAYGGLSERALQRAGELADETLLRILPPRKPSSPKPSTTKQPASINAASSASRLPSVGAMITREYRGKQLVVTVL